VGINPFTRNAGATTILTNYQKASSLSTNDANACIDLINLIGQIKVERHLEILWANILKHTQVNGLLIVVYDSSHRSSYGERVSESSRFSKNIDQRYLDFYENTRAWTCDPILYYCAQNPGVNTTEACWEKPFVPPTEVHKLEEFREMTERYFPSGLVATAQSQTMKGLSAYVAFGLEKGGSDEAVIRKILPHIVNSMFRPGLLSTPDFTDKEMQVIERMMIGDTHKEIADKLFVGEGTIKFHLVKIFSKLEVSNRIEATEVCRKMFRFK